MIRRFTLAAFIVAATLGGAQTGFADETPDAKWKGHTGKIPFVIGFDDGLAEAKFTGKPMMVFFTAVW